MEAEPEFLSALVRKQIYCTKSTMETIGIINKCGNDQTCTTHALKPYISHLFHTLRVALRKGALPPIFEDVRCTLLLSK